MPSNRDHFEMEMSKEIGGFKEDLYDLRKENDAEHERIRTKLDELEKRRADNDTKELENDLNDLRKQNSSTHERLFEKVNALEKKGDVQDIQHKQNLEKITELSKDVHEIKDKPSKRMDNITDKIISLIVAAVVGFILAKIGLG